MKISIDFGAMYKLHAKKHLNGLLKIALTEFEELVANNYTTKDAVGNDIPIDFISIRKKLLDRHGAALREIDELCEQIKNF